MTYTGRIRNGAIMLDEPVRLPEGSVVKLELAVVSPAEEAQEVPTLAERLSTVIGKAEDMPADWADNHDDYLRKAYAQ